MTTTTLRYNGRAFIYAPTSLVTTDGEEHGNEYAKEPRLELTTPDVGWGIRERTEKLIGRLAMIGFDDGDVIAFTQRSASTRLAA